MKKDLLKDSMETVLAQETQQEENDKLMKKFLHIRFLTSRGEFGYFLKLHFVIYIIVYLVRIKNECFSDQCHCQISRIFPSTQKVFITLFLSISAFTVPRMSQKPFKYVFLLILFLGLFTSVDDLMLYKKRLIKYPTHQAQISSLFFFYFGLNAPVNWYVTTVINFGVWTYYFVQSAQYYGMDHFNWVELVQHTVVSLLVTRALYLKQQEDLQNLSLNRRIKKQQRYYFQILQAIPEGILIVDKTFERIQFTNQCMVQFFQDKISEISRYLLKSSSQSEDNQELGQTSSFNKLKFLDYNYQLCQQLAQNIKKYVLEPLLGKLSQQQPTNQNNKNNLRQPFLQLIQQQVNQSTENCPQYYNLLVDSKIYKDQSQSNTIKLYNKFSQREKRRVEIKHKALNNEQILIIVKDVSHLKELEKNRSKNRLKTLLFASQAHELLTPINILQGMNEEAMFLVGSKKSQLSECLLKTKYTIQKLNYLTEDIIDLSKYELKEIHLNISNFPIQSVINEVISMHSYEIKNKNLELIVDLKMNQRNNISTDRKRIKRIISVLLGNSIKYTQFGYIKMKVSLLHESDDAYYDEYWSYKQQILYSDSQDKNQQHNYQHFVKSNYDLDSDLRIRPQKVLKFVIEDSGIGIPNKKIEKLFELFGNIEFQGKVNKGGIGLGLATCQALCNHMGGFIIASRNHDQGSKFKFFIDVSQEQTQSQRVIQKLPFLEGNEENADIIIKPSSAFSLANQQSQSYFTKIIEQNNETSEHLTDQQLNQENCEDAQSLADVNLLSERINEYIFETKVNNLESFEKEQDHAHFILSQRDSNPIQDEPEIDVLIIDDNSFNVEVAGRMIERHTGLPFDPAYCAKDGITKIKLKQKSGKQYKYIFVDINMPEMDGITMVQHLRKLEEQRIVDFKDSIIFALTAVDESQLGNLQEQGFDYYIAKPVNWEILKEFFD